MRAIRLLPLLAALSASSARADEPDPVVVTVASRSLRKSDVARRLALVPAYQAASLGRDPDEARKRLVDTVLVPELLGAEEGERRGLGAEPRARARLRDALARVLVDTIRTEARATPIAEAEARAYYEAHAAEYSQPERLRLSRILVDDEGLARRILSAVRGPEAARRWAELAREHSLDAATKMRGGQLGFVHPDGRTDVPQVAVDPALFDAARKVRDGELVPDPVHEGSHLAVVWRRGSLPALSRTFEAERARIEELLLRERGEKAVTALLAELRKRELRTFEPAPLESWKPRDVPAAPVAPMPAAGPLASSDPAPRRTERGLR